RPAGTGGRLPGAGFCASAVSAPGHSGRLYLAGLGRTGGVSPGQSLSCESHCLMLETEMSASSLRLFFALSCPPRPAQDLLAWREQAGLGGHWISPDNLHITLAFLDNQPSERLPALQ